MKKQDVLNMKHIFRKLKNGNNKVIEELYKEYRYIVYGIAFSILKNKEDSEDVMQVIFSKLYEMDEAKLPEDKEATWLYSVTKNEALMYIRKNKPSADIENIYSVEDNDNKIDELIDKDSYNKLINKLDTKEQEIVSLKVLSDLSFAEISSLLGEPIGTIKWRYYKSMHSLKLAISNLSLFIVTFICGILNLKKSAKRVELAEDSTNQKDDVGSNDMDSDYRVDMTEDSEKKFSGEMSYDSANKLNQGMVIDSGDSGDSIMEVPIKEDAINYYGYGLLSLSFVFLTVAIFSAFIFRNHQLKSKRKSSK